MCGNTLLARECAWMQGNVHRGKVEDLMNEGLVKEYKVGSGTGWMDEYQQNRRTSRMSRIFVEKTYDF